MEMCRLVRVGMPASKSPSSSGLVPGHVFVEVGFQRDVDLVFGDSEVLATFPKQ